MLMCQKLSASDAHDGVDIFYAADDFVYMMHYDQILLLFIQIQVIYNQSARFSK